jgi:chromosome segregation ATPase
MLTTIIILQIINIILNIIQNNKIKMTQAELAQQLTDLNTELAKVNTEVQTKLQELADAIANEGNVSPEVETALNNLKTAIQGVDDLIPDA